jgi:uncharacterized protein YrrD
MRVSELKGKTVITAPGGDIIGTVEDVLVRPAEQRVGALVVKSPRFAVPQILLAEDIVGFGGDTVPTESADKLQDKGRFGEAAQMLSLHEAAGRKVATASGNHAGELLEIHIEPATGKITGYEVIGGVFAKMFGRSHTIAASEHTRLGKDLLIVADKVIPTEREKDVHGEAQQ